MAVYADYEFYTNNYGGRNISKEEFIPLAIKASALIDRITFNRATDTECVKMAVCTAADCLYVPSAGGIQSENNDGYSVTYAQKTDSERMTDAVRLIRTFLPRELTNRGCFDDNN